MMRESLCPAFASDVSPVPAGALLPPQPTSAVASMMTANNSASFFFISRTSPSCFLMHYSTILAPKKKGCQGKSFSFSSAKIRLFICFLQALWGFYFSFQALRVALIVLIKKARCLNFVCPRLCLRPKTRVHPVAPYASPQEHARAFPTKKRAG